MIGNCGNYLWMTGFSFGIGLTYPLCGFLIARYGWRSVFYTTGSLGVMWCFIWWVLAFDAPQKHPRITRKELDYIECGIGDSIIMKKVCTQNVPNTYLCIQYLDAIVIVSFIDIGELVGRSVGILFTRANEKSKIEICTRPSDGLVTLSFEIFLIF